VIAASTLAARAPHGWPVMSGAFTLIKAVPTDTERVCAAFEALATKIQRRDGCHRVEALQKAVDEHPREYEAYCRAFGDHASLNERR
jgi:quinol monooxygenase YgiN